MAYYRTCPYCGDHLDPGERCECGETKETEPRVAFSLKEARGDGELVRVPETRAS